MKVIHYFVLGGLVVLTGCASPINNYKPAALDVSEPPLNTVVIKGVGEELLKQGKFAMVTALKVSEPTPVSLYTVHPGLFRLTGSDATTKHYRIGGMGEKSGSVTKSWIADPFQSLMVKKDDNSLCVITIFSGVGCAKGGANTHDEIQTPVLFNNSLQQTLIYSGKVGSQIRVGYREFSDNLARPAFSNDVIYDLNDSKIIAYKGAALEILEATNQFIKYRVLKNFNQAKPPPPTLPENFEKEKDLGA